MVEKRDRVARLGDFLPLGDSYLWAVSLKNYRSSRIFRVLFSKVKEIVLILTENWLGYILGNFFSNSSGRHEEVF
jgi:hypothetical protein